ncbi:MAG: hypothetical protein WC659_02285 [Patescibacteria group bacterium]
MLKAISGIAVVGAASLFAASLISSQYSEMTSAEPISSLWASQRVAHSAEGRIVCASVPQGQEVRGLITNVPLYDTAKRISFDGNGAHVIYTMKATPESVASFYSQNLSQHCWRQSDDGLTFTKNGSAVRIALMQSPESKKTYVTYILGGAVLGESTVNAAQDGSMPPPPSGSSGGVPPPPSGDQGMYNQPSGGYQPPSGGQYQPGPMGTGGSGGAGYNEPQTTTCRVNGVDMPGPCSNYNQSQGGGMGGPGGNGGNTQWGGGQGFGPGNQGGFGQGDQGGQFGQGEQGGPSEEQMKKMDEMRFKQMKQGMGQFAKGVKMMKTSVAKIKTKLQKCGVGLPEELSNALSAADGMVTKIQAAETADALEEVITDIEDVGSVMQEWGPKLGNLTRICGMVKQAEKDIKTAERDATRIEKQVKANKKVDLTEFLNQYKQEVSLLGTALKDAKALTTTDPEAALEKIEDDFYGQMDNVKNARTSVEMALNVSKGLTSAKQEIKTFEQQIKKFKSKKIDTSGAEELLTALKAQIEELKQLVASKNFTADDLIDKVESVFATKEQISDTLDQLRGGAEYMPTVRADKGVNYNFQLPQGFEKQEVMDGENGGQGFMGGGGFNPQGQGMFQGQTVPPTGAGQPATLPAQ